MWKEGGHMSEKFWTDKVFIKDGTLAVKRLLLASVKRLMKDCSKIDDDEGDSSFLCVDPMESIESELRKLKAEFGDMDEWEKDHNTFSFMAWDRIKTIIDEDDSQSFYLECTELKRVLGRFLERDDNIKKIFEYCKTENIQIQGIDVIISTGECSGDIDKVLDLLYREARKKVANELLLRFIREESNTFVLTYKVS